MLIKPMVAGKALLIPRVEYRPKEGGWRALVVIDVPGTRGDAIISDFYESQWDAMRAAATALAEAAARYGGT
jgi:hypothetical protein